MLARIFGSRNDRVIKGYKKQVDIINSYQDAYKKLSDEELQNKTSEFKQRLQKGETLDMLLSEAFATVREASDRVLGMRHYDVQIIGGIVLHQGKIAEMKTGEGKTVVATLAVYLNALAGDGVHVVTVNDYLAKRDSEWMGKLYKFLGLTVGCLTNDKEGDERKQQYYADITYGTNNEFGFDYLRDNLKLQIESIFQRGHKFAIVDEVDSILIDEARTPLIISGPTDDKTEIYAKTSKIVPLLDESFYEIEEKSRSINLTDQGSEEVERLLRANNLLSKDANLYDIENISILHGFNQSLKAHKIFKKDVDYMVKGDRIMIIDEFTGRLKEGSRYSDGLHQAIEAKEGVKILQENQTLASITYQNYFRLYEKLAGMTGTAMTEAAEFDDIYSLEVVEIPTHLKISRQDDEDEIFRTVQEKENAIVDSILESHSKNQPVLVGTVSVEQSEKISSILKKRKIPHNVLNAKQHEKEAPIISQAGRPKAITIATNMAGRGTDIKLGGNIEDAIGNLKLDNLTDNEKNKLIEQTKKEHEQAKKQVIEAGGLFVLGTERHESRRIDNQLRGRSGRQGDIGKSRFYLSIQDDLMRIFGTDRLDNMLKKMGMKEGESITHPWVTRSLETAQKKVEGRNYDARKHILKFDDVTNDQRKEIYEQRLAIMERDDLKDEILEMRQEVLEEIIDRYMPQGSYSEQWDTKNLTNDIYTTFGVILPIEDWAKQENASDVTIMEQVKEVVEDLMSQKENDIGSAQMRSIEKQILLATLDYIWKDHLHELDNLRQGIGLRSYGQKDPLREYKAEAFKMFSNMLDSLKFEVTQKLSFIQFKQDFNLDLLKELEEQAVDTAKEGHGDVNSKEDKLSEPELTTVIKRVYNQEERDPEDPSTWGRVGRNELCPCNSGKKYKHCHGKLS